MRSNAIHRILALDKVEVWFKRQFCVKLSAFHAKNKYVMSKAMMDVVVLFLGDEGGCPNAFVVPQFAGGSMYVSPGWMHAVVNVQSNWKVSWEFHDIVNIVAYAEAWHFVRRRNGLNNPESYMHTPNIVVEWLYELTTEVKPAVFSNP